MPDLVRAPWTAEQVAALNDWQKNDAVHPFTCANDHGTQEDRELVATTDGWICRHCDYRQDWAHRMMMEPPHV